MTNVQAASPETLAAPPIPTDGTAKGRDARTTDARKDAGTHPIEFAALTPPDGELLAQASTPPLQSSPVPPGELWRAEAPVVGGEISLAYGFDPLDIVRTSSHSLFGFSVSQPSDTVVEGPEAQGRMSPSFGSPTFGGKVPDWITNKIPYVGPILSALPGDLKASVGVELRDGTTTSGDPTDELHIKLGATPASGEIKLGDAIEKGVGSALSRVPIHPEVREAIQEQIGSRIGALRDLKGPDGKPLVTADGKLSAEAGLSFDFVIETAKGNPLQVESVEVFVGVSGRASASASAGFGISQSEGLRAVTSGQLSARWERDPGTAPPEVVPPGDAFVRLNDGDTRAAYAITEELLDGKASIRYPQDGTIQHGVQVSPDETSVWDLSAVSDGRNHGHPALEVANSVNAVLREAGALPPGQSVGSTERAGQLLRAVYAGADPSARQEIVAAIENPIGLNFGLADVADANRGLEAANGALPGAEAFRQRFLSTNVYY